MENDKTFIYYKEDFIDSPKIIEKLLEYKKTDNYTTNHNSWEDRNLVPDGVGVIKRWRVCDTEMLDYLCLRLAYFFEETRTSSYKFDFEITEWNTGSFLPFHDDNGYVCAATCYLEDTTNYGGEFLCKPFEDQSLGMFLEPKINRVVFLKGVEHAVTKIHNGTRTTLQMWGRYANV